MASKKRLKVVVTGGAGMIGSNLVKALVRRGDDVHVVDNLWRGRLSNLEVDGKPVIDIKRRFFKRDLRHPGILEKCVPDADLVIHLADVVAGVDYVFRNQGDIFRDNILINTNVIASTRIIKPSKGYLYVGTACSFPYTLQTGVKARPLREEDQYPAHPESAYGWSKLMGEYEAELMQKETGIPVAILVFHNVYGYPCDFGPRSQVIPSLVRKAIRHPQEEFVVWGSGRQGRAFVHVDDVVDALLRALRHGMGKGPIQIGPDSCTAIRDIAKAVVKISGKPVRIRFDLTKPEGDKGRCADYSKARKILGWKPTVSLEKGLRQLYRKALEEQERGLL